MTSQPDNPSSGLPPMPVTELTIEQDFHLRRLEDLLPKAEKEDIITIFMALQRQNYALANTVKNLLAQWPTHIITDEEKWNLGTLYETKDYPST
jgi:hypothetical protein